MSVDLPALSQKHAEFTELFEAFVHEVLDSEEGRAHLAVYEESREAARRAYAELREDATLEAALAQELPEPRTAAAVDAVLTKLLPHTDTEANRAAGRWISAAPAFTGDVRVRYEAAGWVEPGDWPRIAGAIWHFVRRCVENPAALVDAIAEFADLPDVKGFQMGVLSPILNALRPDDYVIGSARSRRVIDYFAGTRHKPHLTDYPDFNTTAFGLLDMLAETMHTLEVSDGRDCDLLDAFCNWLVTARDYDFQMPELLEAIPSAVSGGAATGSELGAIFVSREEAEWALNLMRETLVRLGAEGPEDKRVAITVRRGAGGDTPPRSRGPALRLTFGNWAVLMFLGPCHRQFRVGLALLEGHLDVMGPYDFWRPFADAGVRPGGSGAGGAGRDRSQQEKVTGSRVRVYLLPMDTVNPMPGSLRRTYERTLDLVAARFGDWRASNFRRYHRPDIAAAVFDPDARDRLLDTSYCMPTAEGRGLPAFPERQRVSENQVREGEKTYETAIAPAYGLEACARDTGLDVAMLRRWVRAIERKQQAILYGPPGTGKTYVAEALARHLVAGGDGFRTLIQFHPAYAYEDFIQGLRPRSDEDGHLVYEMVPGRFLEFCAQARRRTGRCVLVIDEINRADLSRVFGEVMVLLEYRDREIPLAGGGSFSIPANVRILGTMNTADRSIALVDHALRRRFAFLPLYPDFDMLRRYHQRRETGFPVEALVRVLQRLNRQIGDVHYHVGVTYFLRPDLAQHLGDIWQMEIEPYLEEIFFDQPDRVAAFRWEQIRGDLPSAATAEPAEDPPPPPQRPEEL